MEIMKVSSSSIPNHVARDYVIPTGKELVCVPSFYDLTIDN